MWVYRSASLLAMFSGAAALAHQLLWTRRLIDLLGASHESAARVFGCFFLGLSLGAAVAAWLVPKVRRPWLWVAVAEVGVAILSLPAIFLPTWTAWLWPTLGPEALLDWRGGMIKLAVSICIVLPPALIMGTTLPWLGIAVLRGNARLARQGVRLYAANTVGGVAGLAITVLILLQLWGATGAMWAAVSLNLCIAAGFLLMHHLDTQATVDETVPTQTMVNAHPPPDDHAATTRWWAGVLAFISGFGILAFEVAVLQVLMLVAPLSFYAPAAILMVIIALLAVGAALTPILNSRISNTGTLLPWSMVVTGIAVLLTPPLYFMVVDFLGGLHPQPRFAGWLWQLTLLTLLAIGPAVLLAALVFPCTLVWVSRQGGDPHGRRWGWLLAANGLGGLVGAELTYRILLPGLGPHVSIGVVGLVYIVTAMVFAYGSITVQWMHLLRPTAGAAAIAGITILLLWLPRLPLVNEHVGFTLLDHRSGREGTVAVVEREGDLAILMANQYILGSTAARWDQERQAHLPLLLHHQPRRVATIGIATGITPGAVLQHPPVEQLTAIELSPLVVQLADQHFRHYNNNVLNDPRTVVAIEDGRTYIAAANQRFDVIIGDLFLPWGPGEARLYSVEHFDAVREALDDGGVFCQWLAMYQLTPSQFLTVAATFQHVFGQTHVVINGFHARQPVLGLVGFRHHDWDERLIAQRCADARHAGILDPLMRHPQGVALLHLGPLDVLADVPVNTLDNMIVELHAGRERVTGQPGTKYFSGERWYEGLQRMPLAETARFDQRRTQPLMMNLVAWEAANRPENHAASLDIDLPAPLREDPLADPSRWPGDPRWLAR